MRRPEFSLLDAQKKSFDAQSRLARSALLPRASFVFAYGIDAATNPAGMRGYAAYFNFSIPVFAWYRARSGAQQFRFRVQQVDSSRSIAERNLSKEYQNARTRVQNHYEQIADLEQQVRLAQQNLEISRVRYEGGEGLALDVVVAQADWAQARTNYFTNLANFWAARVDLEVASGR
jgi:outer membrane protein TolC